MKIDWRMVVRTKLREWLGIAECEFGVNDIRNDLLNMSRSQYRQDTELDKINKHIFVGVDHHIKDESWAVVCLEGKVNIVKFYRGKPKDIQELARWLKQWEETNLIVDTHPTFRQALDFEMRDIR